MKKLLSAIIILVCFLCESCEPAVTFDKPQPENAKSLKSFPARLQGKYLAADQASIVTITDKLVIRLYDFDYKEHKDNLTSSYKISGDTIINLTNGTKDKILLKGDTVIQHANWTDTLFKISDENILKKFKGYYFLNIRYNENAWEVKELALKKGMLTLGTISDKDDIKKLKEITETSADTTSTHFSLTRRQFKKFVKEDGFGEQEKFTRIAVSDR